MILVYVDVLGSKEEIPKYTEYIDKYKIKAKVTDDPNEYMQSAYKYTHIFLDYGGLDMPGNSLFTSHCREVDRVITEYPNVTFVVISSMGRHWFERDMNNLDEPNVIFMDDFTDPEELHKVLNIKYIPEVIKRPILITPKKGWLNTNQ